MTVIDWCPRYFKLQLNDDVMVSVGKCLDGEGYESTVIILDPHETNILLVTRMFSSGKKHDTMEEAEAELFNAIGQLLMKQLMSEEE